MSGTTFENAVREHFIEPLEDGDLAVVTRIWAKLHAAQTGAPQLAAS